MDQEHNDTGGRDSQQELIFNHSVDLTFLLGVEGDRYRFITVNNAFLNAAHLTKEQVEGKYAEEVIPAALYPAILVKYNQAIQQRQTVQWEDTSDYPDGRRTGVISVTPVYNEKDVCTFLVGSVHDITERKKVIEEKEKVSYQLNERIKELTTLYRADQVLQDEAHSTDKMLQDFVDILPAGWQYPEITEACILLGDKKYATAGYARQVASQSATFMVPGGKTGTLAVAYTDERPEHEEGPFLAEERNLIKMLAEKLKLHFARKGASNQLLKEKELSESIINSLPGVFYVFDMNGKYLRWNKNHETVTGYTTSEMETMHPLKFIDEQEKGLVAEKIGKVFTEGFAEVEAYFLRKDGKKIPYYFNGVAITYENKPCLMGVGIDITERKQAEEALQKSEANLHTVFDTTDTIYTLLDTDFQVISFNQQAADFTRNELLGELKLNSSLINYFPEERRKILDERMKKVLQGDSVNYESSYSQPDGSVHWYHVRMMPVSDRPDNIFGLMVAVSDITEKKVLEQQILGQRIEEQKKITRAILNAQEKERNSIGQELHDNVNQILVGAKIFLGLTKGADPANEGLIKKSMELIDDAVDEIRSLTREQVTPRKKIDLKDLVQSLVEKLKEQAVVETTFIYDVDTAVINDDLKLNIYRIIQEGINNIVKHASAKHAIITVKAVDKTLYVSIIDDGKGLDTSKKPGGIGINNILNRVESYNGRIAIDSTPQKGCKIELAIPL